MRPRAQVVGVLSIVRKKEKQTKKVRPFLSASRRGRRRRPLGRLVRARGGSRPRKGRRSVRCPVDGGDCLVPFRDARQACVGQRPQINIRPRGAQAQGPRPPPPPVFPFHLSASSRCSFLTSRISGTRYGFAGRAQVYKGADLGALRRRLVLFSTSSCCFLPALPTLGSSTLYLALATPCATLSAPRPNHVVASMDHDPK